MSLLGKLKSVFCQHKRTAHIFRSRRYPTIKEEEVVLWRDSLIGAKCLDCGLLIVVPEINLSHYPYSGDPHYEVME